MSNVTQETMSVCDRLMTEEVARLRRLLENSEMLREIEMIKTARLKEELAKLQPQRIQMQEPMRAYLGNSIYMQWDGKTIELSIGSSPFQQHTINLGPEAMDDLMAFWARVSVKGEKHD